MIIHQNWWLRDFFKKMTATIAQNVDKTRTIQSTTKNTAWMTTTTCKSKILNQKEQEVNMYKNLENGPIYKTSLVISSTNSRILWIPTHLKFSIITSDHNNIIKILFQITRFKISTILPEIIMDINSSSSSQLLGSNIFTKLKLNSNINNSSSSCNKRWLWISSSSNLRKIKWIRPLLKTWWILTWVFHHTNIRININSSSSWCQTSVTSSSSKVTEVEVILNILVDPFTAASISRSLPILKWKINKS